MYRKTIDMGVTLFRDRAIVRELPPDYDGPIRVGDVLTGDEIEDAWEACHVDDRRQYPEDYDRHGNAW